MSRVSLLAIAVLVVAVVVATRSQSPSPSPAPRDDGERAAVATPNPWREVRPPARERLIAELAARLTVDPAARSGGARRATLTVPAGVATARHMQDDICPGVNRLDDCHDAVGRSAIRRLWRSMRRSPAHGRKAEVLAEIGRRLGLNVTDVANAVRAELDTQLTRAEDAGALSARVHALVMACYDTPVGCERLARRRR